MHRCAAYEKLLLVFLLFRFWGRRYFFLHGGEHRLGFPVRWRHKRQLPLCLSVIKVEFISEKRSVFLLHVDLLQVKTTLEGSWVEHVMGGANKGGPNELKNRNIEERPASLAASRWGRRGSADLQTKRAALLRMPFCSSIFNGFSGPAAPFSRSR